MNNEIIILMALKKAIILLFNGQLNIYLHQLPSLPIMKMNVFSVSLRSNKP